MERDMEWSLVIGYTSAENDTRRQSSLAAVGRLIFFTAPRNSNGSRKTVQQWLNTHYDYDNGVYILALDQCQTPNRVVHSDPQLQLQALRVPHRYPSAAKGMGALGTRT